MGKTLEELVRFAVNEGTSCEESKETYKVEEIGPSKFNIVSDNFDACMDGFAFNLEIVAKDDAYAFVFTDTAYGDEGVIVYDKDLKHLYNIDIETWNPEVWIREEP